MVALDRVAGPAGVKQVVVVELLFGKQAHGDEVINREARDDIGPDLTFQAVHTPKDKLIPQPRTKALQVVVASGAVMASMPRCGITASVHGFRCGAGLARCWSASRINSKA